LNTRRAAGSVIVGSWVCCIGWAVARQVTRPPEAYLETRAARLAPGAAFYQITLGDQPIGNAGITLDTMLAGYKLTEVWNMDLGRARTAERFVFRSDAELSRSLLLRRISVTMSEAGKPRTLEALRGNDTTWEVTLRQRGSRPATVANLIAPKASSAPGALPFRLVLDGRLSEGNVQGQPVLAILQGTVDHDSATVTRDSIFAVADSAVWDSSAASWIAVDPRPTRAWRVERTVHGFPSIDWIDSQGRLIVRDWAFGLRLQRTPFEVNYNMYQARLRSGEVRPPENVPGAVARSELSGAPDTVPQVLRVRLARIDGPAWPGATDAFAGGRQQVLGDTVTIRSEPVPQSIRGLLERVGSAPRNERVSRFVTLATSAGLTARAVTGIDLSRPELPSHTWAEVLSGDAWIAVDPAYGQAPASVSLLRIIIGGSDRPLTLVPLIASLKPTTLSIQ